MEKDLIIIKGEDKTLEVNRCNYKNGKWHVEFHNGKIYPYSYDNISRDKNPTSLDPAVTKVYQKGIPLSGIHKIVVFKEYIRIFFKSGYTKLHHRSEITIDQSCLVNPGVKNTFEI